LSPAVLSTYLAPLRRRRGAAAVIAVLVAVGILAPQGASAAPDRAKPTVSSIAAQLDRLAQQAETLAEQYNANQLAITTQQRQFDGARVRQAAAEAQYEAARKRFIPMVVAQYEDGGFDTVGAMLTSDDPAAYLDSLATQNLVSQHWADVLDQLTAARHRAERAAHAADNLLTSARQARATLDDKRQAVRDQTAKYQRLLSVLTAAQRAAYSTRGAPTTAEITAALATPAPTPAAKRAVQFAVDQVGKPYVWAATGPASYDCSGLTMAAWAHAGVKLPHFSAAQYTHGKHVGYNQVEPGDLVFLYSDLHHVEMYVGAGLAVSAPQEGEDVKFVHLSDYRADFSGATRPS
jgi:cell wall-associated NlpC family hydrolase